MIQIKFKNLTKSELAKEAVENRLDLLIEKFPDLKNGKIQVTLEMENSPIQAGPDVFNVRLLITKGRYKGIAIEKSHSNLYVALADVMDHMLERMNRYGDKVRVKERAQARQMRLAIKTELA